MNASIDTHQADTTVGTTSFLARGLAHARRAATGFLAFLGDAIVQLAVEDICMAFVTATVSAVVGLQLAA